MKGLRLITVLILVLSGTCSMMAQIRIVPREKIEAVANPRHSADSASLKFESTHIMAEPMREDDSPVTFIYRFTNVGQETLEIKRIVTTCSCASAICPVKSVRPGEASEIRVRYNPKGHPGRFVRRVFVYTEDGDDPAAELKLSVNVTSGPDLSADWPVQLGYIRLKGDTVELTGDTGELRFINLSGTDMRLRCDEHFLPPYLTFSTVPAVVPAGEEGKIIVRYDSAEGEAADMMRIFLKGTGLQPTKARIKVVTDKMIK